MNPILNTARTACLLALLAFLAACATDPGTENMLAAAGFRAKIASTPQQIAHLKTLPAGKVTLVQRQGQIFYVYPDAAHNTAYVGTPQAYQTYQQYRLQKQLSNENLLAAQASETQPIVWEVWGPGFWY